MGGNHPGGNHMGGNHPGGNHHMNHGGNHPMGGTGGNQQGQGGPPGSHFLVVVPGVKSSAPETKTQHGILVAYKSQGTARNVWDAVRNMRRKRVDDRTQRVAAAILHGLNTSPNVVIVAMSHGALLTTNALFYIASQRAQDMSRITVFSLGAPRFIPERTRRFALKRCVNLYHVRDQIMYHKTLFGGEKDKLVTKEQGRNLFHSYVSTQTECANPHVCFGLIRHVTSPEEFSGLSRLFESVHGGSGGAGNFM